MERRGLFRAISEGIKVAKEPFRKMEGMLRYTRDSIGKADGFKKEFALTGIISFADREIRKHPELEYGYARIAGLAHKGLGEYEDALQLLQISITQHPDKSEKSDFPDYVGDYLGAVNDIQHMPEESQQQARDNAIVTMRELLDKVPSIAFRLNGFIGAMHANAGRHFNAIPYLERAVLAHPQHTGSDFSQYVTNYLNSERLFAHEAIQKVRNKNREGLVELALVVTSTANILLLRPELEEVRQENFAVASWLNTHGGKDFRTGTIRVHKSSNN